MTTVGPTMTDAEFFETLDYSNPKLAEVKKLKDASEFPKARVAFLEFVRATLEPEKYYELPGKVLKPEFTEKLAATAKRALEHDMVSVGVHMKFDGEVDWCANPTYNKYAEWTWQLSRHSEINSLATAYRATGDERYAEGAVELLSGWIRQAIPPELTESGFHTLLWRTIECGIRMFTWPNIILSILHSPHFTADFCTDVFKSLYQHAQQLTHRFTSHNWLLMELNGLIHIALIYPVFRECGEWLDIASKRALQEVDLQVHPDGLQFELTTGYQGVVISNFMQLAEVAEHYGAPMPDAFLKKLENLVMAYIRLMMSDGRLPNINDGSHAYAKDHVARFFHQYPDNENFKWLLSDGEEGKAPDFLSCLLKYSGLAVLRDGWSKNNVSVFFDAGKFGRAHQHEDKLNLLICNGEKNVLCEAQSYAYDTSDMRKYVLSSFGHNTVTVNGHGQSRRPRYRWNNEDIDKVEDIDHLFDTSVDFVKGRYDEFYASTRPATHERSVAFFKTPKLGRPFVAVVDRLAPVESEENRYEAMWHFDTDEVTLAASGAVCREMTVFTFGEDEKRIVKGQEQPNVQGFICRSTIQGSFEPIPTLICTANGGEREMAALFALNEDGKCPIERVEYSDGCFTVTYLNGEVDTLSERELSSRAVKA